MNDLLWALFDEEFYAARYPDAVEAVRKGAYPDLFTHYLRVGAARDYRPSRLFDPALYASANPDVAALVERGLYPHVAAHYVMRGRDEGRIGSRELPHGEMTDWIDDLTPRTAMAMVRQNTLFGLERIAAEEFERQVLRTARMAA